MGIKVDAAFAEDGQVRVRRVDGRMVEQGRQWTDDDGRHVLVMWHGRARELVLNRKSLQWKWSDHGRMAA